MTVPASRAGTAGRLLPLEDGQLEYWEAGSGLPLLFVHGVATSGELWLDDLQELATDARLIVYNRRGYGGSSPSPGSWEVHGADAATLIERLNAAPATVCGYSGGAMVALKLALARPDLVAQLVLLDPACNLRRCLTPGLLRTLAVMKVLRWTGAYHEAARLWLRYVSSYSTGGTAFDRIPEARRERLLGNIAGIFGDFAADGGEVEERRLFDIVAPVTIVDAALSPSFLRRSSRRLQQRLPGARRITLDRSGHWIGFDAREDLLRILREAVRSS